MKIDVKFRKMESVVCLVGACVFKVDFIALLEVVRRLN